MTDEKLLTVFRETVDPVLSTLEVAEALPIRRRGTLNRLWRLQEAGHLDSKQIGGRNTVWWLTDEEERDRRERIETPQDSVRNDTASTLGNETDGEHGPVTDDSETVAEQNPRMATGATLVDLVDDVAEETLPGSGEKIDERREAFHAVVAYLRKHGTATPADLREEVYPKNNGAYIDGQDPARSWWKNAMYPALAGLARRTDHIQGADQSGK